MKIMTIKNLSSQAAAAKFFTRLIFNPTHASKSARQPHRTKALFISSLSSAIPHNTAVCEAVN
jgi:hypothetical protein